MSSFLVSSVIFSLNILLLGFPRQAEGGDSNVALGAACCASSQYSSAFGCELAVDGSITTEFASLQNGVGMWLSLQLDQMYVIRSVRVMDRANEFEKSKELRLTFMDGSNQTITLAQFGWGAHWNELMSITPVVTNSVTITTVSVYASGNNGFIEFELYGVPASKDLLPGPVCPKLPDTLMGTDGDWKTVVKGTVEPANRMTWDFLYENLSCFSSCMQSPGCKGVVINMSTGECTIVSATCILHKLAGNDDVIWRL